MIGKVLYAAALLFAILLTVAPLFIDAWGDDESE